MWLAEEGMKEEGWMVTVTFKSGGERRMVLNGVQSGGGGDGALEWNRKPRGRSGGGGGGGDG